MLDYNNVKCSLIYTTQKLQQWKMFATTATYCKTIKLFANIRQQLKCSPKLNVYSNEMFASTLQMSDGRWRCRLVNTSDELLVRRWVVATWSRPTWSRSSVCSLVSLAVCRSTSLAYAWLSPWWVLSRDWRVAAEYSTLTWFWLDGWAYSVSNVR